MNYRIDRRKILLGTAASLGLASVAWPGAASAAEVELSDDDTRGYLAMIDLEDSNSVGTREAKGPFSFPDDARRGI